MKRVLVTRSHLQADEFADKLRSAGFEPIYFPVIEIKPIENNLALERALSKLNCYEWIVFTSVNAVEVVFNHMPSPRLGQPSPAEKGDGGEGVKFATIGPRTAEALQARGITPDFVPQEYVAEAI